MRRPQVTRPTRTPADAGSACCGDLRRTRVLHDHELATPRPTALAPKRGVPEPRRAPLHVTVDRPRARFSAWYELFPRSTVGAPLGGDEDRHGSLRDVIDRLDRIASMGFDVLYLPPIHPIGFTQAQGTGQ
jgi:hypothetical protein